MSIHAASSSIYRLEIGGGGNSQDQRLGDGHVYENMMLLVWGVEEFHVLLPITDEEEIMMLHALMLYVSSTPRPISSRARKETWLSTQSSLLLQLR